jgi:hypothetical protein
MCKECKSRGKTWQGDDPKCAFNSEEFNSNNWNCATIGILRNIAQERLVAGAFDWRDDDNNESIGIIPLPEIDEIRGYLVLTWYKERGQTGGAVIVCGEEKPAKLTIDIAQKVIDHYRSKNIIK